MNEIPCQKVAPLVLVCSFNHAALQEGVSMGVSLGDLGVMTFRHFWYFTAATMALSACSSPAPGPAITPQDPGYVALVKGNYEAAKTALTAELAAHPNDPYVQLNLALANQMTGHMDQAERLYRAVMVTGRGVYPAATTTDRAAGMSLDQIACENLKAGLKNPNAC